MGTWAKSNNCVVALSCVGSLFGFLKVKDVVDSLAPFAKGRLLIFLPGSYEGNSILEQDDNWQQLDPDQKFKLRSAQQLLEANKPTINVDSTKSVLATLDNLPLVAFKDRVAAMSSHFESLLLDAARIMEPAIQKVRLSSQVLKTRDDVDAWLSKAKEILIEKLKKGPVII